MDHILTEWIDRNGLVKPQKAWRDSGNGLLYTAVWLMLTGCRDISIFTDPIGRLEIKSGLYARTPENQFGQEQWDNYLGLAALCFGIGNTAAARSVIWYGIKHFGFYDTDGKLEGKDWLWRFPQVWVLMWLAAFPKIKWVFWPAWWVVGRFMNPNPADASGCQLAWLFHWVGFLAYGTGKDRLKTLFGAFVEGSKTYYSNGHPIAEEAYRVCMNLK